MMSRVRVRVCVRVNARVRVRVLVRVRVRVRIRRKEPQIAQEVLSSVAVLCPTVADDGATRRSLAKKLFISDPTCTPEIIRF